MPADASSDVALEAAAAAADASLGGDLPMDIGPCVDDTRGDTWQRVARYPDGGTFADTRPHFFSGLLVVEFGAPERLGSFVYSVGSDCNHFAGVVAPGTPALLVSATNGLPDIEVTDDVRCRRSVWRFDGRTYAEDRTRARACTAPAGKLRPP